MAKTAFIIGATSAMATEVAAIVASQNYNLALSSRDEDELKKLSSDLEIKYGVKAKILPADLSFVNFSSEELVNSVFSEFGAVDEAYFFSGNMGSAEIDLHDIKNIKNVIKVNFSLVAEVISLTAEKMLENNGGKIAIISSVAGDRGRASNYIYGSSKAGLSAFASGLRNKLSGKNVHVMTVKPGFIDTPMTWGMESPLIYPREKAAMQIIKALHKNKDLIYVPFFWRYIMLIINHIPEKIFKKLKL